MIFILLSLTLHIYGAPCDMINSIRSSYHEISNKDQLDDFIQQLIEINCKEAQPYLASAIMQKAEYAFFPTSKLKYFKRGKKLLESFIQVNPNDLEARYVRVLVQSKIPSILGYKGNIKSDVKFITSQIKVSKLPPDYQDLILLNIHKATDQ